MERRTDSHSRDRIDEIARNYNRFNKRALAVLLVLTILTTAFGVLSVWLTFENRHRAHEALALSQAIQDERAESVRRNCQDQNHRHDNTINKLNAISDTVIAQDPSRRAQVTMSIQQSIILINAIIPKRDCEKLANRTVKATTEVTTGTTP